MKTAEDLFRESIEHYQEIIQHASNISNEIPSSSPVEILQRCEHLQKLQTKQVAIDTFIIDVMVAAGPDILNTPSIGEYQRILNSAMQCCDAISEKATSLRTRLKNEIDKLHNPNEGKSLTTSHDMADSIKTSQHH